MLGFEYLVDAWSKAGRFSSGANGPIPITWVELSAFRRECAPWIGPFEMEIIRMMSAAFCDELNAEHDRPQPYIVGQDIQTTAERLEEAEQQRIKASFGAH